MKKALLLGGLILFMFSCKTKTYSYDENPGAKIVFGEGGGFAGTVTKYSIFDNGQVFVQEGFDASTANETTSLKKKEAKKLLKELKKLNFTKIKYNKPGNVYQFIGLQLKDSMHKVQWPLNDKNINAAVPALYKKLTSLVKQSND